MKNCIGCGETKPLSEFYVDTRRNTVMGTCKACQRARVTAWRRANPEKARLAKRGKPTGKKRVRDLAKMREYNRAYNATDKAKAARARWSKGDKFKASQQRSAQRTRWPKTILATYGVTVEDYAWMLYGQNFCCAICNGILSVEVVRHEDQRRKMRPCIDHCHQTGTVRGILCSGCNYNIVGPLESGGDVQLIRALRYIGWSASKMRDAIPAIREAS